MSSPAQESRSLWTETPLIWSSHISALLDCDVYLKLENLQPSQSFKYRGISLFAQHCKATRGDDVHLIIASGGNAGLGAACAANRLGLKCTVYLPEGTDQRMVDFLEKERAKVVKVGKYYFESAREAQNAVYLDPNACYVHGYEGPLLWKGHGSMITETARQLSEKPDAIFCSVGGGGLLGGVLDGCKAAGWDDVPVVALETHGAAAFYHSISMNHGEWDDEPRLPDGAKETFNEDQQVKVANVQITSRALSLAATSPSPFVIKAALERRGGIICASIPDEMAMSTACLFAEDHKFLVELACSTTLSVGYHPDFFKTLQETHLNKGSKDSKKRKTVVFIVCGGVKISLEEMHEYGEIVQGALKQGKRKWNAFCNGARWDVQTRS